MESTNLQYILNRLPIGMVMLDRECRILSFSGTAAALFGPERVRQSLGHSIFSIHPVHSHSKIEWLLKKTEDNSSPNYASMLINAPDKILQLRMERLNDVSGLSGYCLVLYDITDLASGPAGTDEAEGDMPSVRRLVKLPVATHDRIALLDIDQVMFIRADGHYTQIFADGKFYFCNMSISQLESRLPTEKFFRAHRSYLVNLGFATEVSRRDDQFEICLAGHAQERIPVSRGNLSRLRQLLGV